MKCDIELTHEVFENVDMDTMTNVQESAIVDLFLLPMAHDLNVYIEIKIQVISGSLHSPNSAVNVESRPAALTS